MLQVATGVAAKLVDAEVPVHYHPGGAVLGEQDAVGLFLDIQARLGLGARGRLPPDEFGLDARRALGGEFEIGGQSGGFAAVHLVFLVHQREKVRRSTDGLGGAEQEIATGVERVVENGHALSLQFRSEVDQHVAATDEVQAREGRVFTNVLSGKRAHVADHATDLVTAATEAGEEPPQSLRRNVLGNAAGENAGPRLRDGDFAQVSAENLKFDVALRPGHFLHETDGQGIDFLPRGAAWHPDANFALAAFAFDDFGNNLFFQRGIHRVVAEKSGHIDQ